MVVLFTDFGFGGPYLGQMKAVIAQLAPGEAVIDLFADAPVQDPVLAAYLLAAYAPEFPVGSVFLCVVDPGVGSERRAVLLRADDRWYVGPDNGLFNVIAMRAREVHWWDIEWRPERLSASFHGRDLFAPVAARLALGEMPDCIPRSLAERIAPGWSQELSKVVYIDHYGNAMTGIRSQSLPKEAKVRVGKQAVGYARIFSDRAPGAAFWYPNSNDLVEIAVNRGRADRDLNLRVGTAIEWFA